MGLTLNGIAQGYATDRVVAILRAEGIERSLVDMGESRASGPRRKACRGASASPTRTRPSGWARPWSIVDNAVATSGAYGFRFDPKGRFNHLLDPKSGGRRASIKSVT